MKISDAKILDGKVVNNIFYRWLGLAPKRWSRNRPSPRRGLGRPKATPKAVRLGIAKVAHRPNRSYKALPTILSRRKRSGLL
jgi:hypothetical protein